jgi:CRISPR/Cas system endoribonuclease Cas6 (RAMP superfamily)
MILTQARYTFGSAPNLQHPAASLGPYLQGFLMKSIASDYADHLHTLPFNPYSQYLTEENGQLAWVLSTLTDEATEQIIKPLSEVSSIYMLAVHERG